VHTGRPAHNLTKNLRRTVEIFGDSDSLPCEFAMASTKAQLAKDKVIPSFGAKTKLKHAYVFRETKPSKLVTFRPPLVITPPQF